MTNPSHTVVCNSFFCLYSCISAFSNGSQQSKHSSSHITDLCPPYGVLAGHHGPLRSDLTFSSFFHFHLEHHASGVCNHSSQFPEQTLGSSLSGFVHIAWPTQKIQPCYLSTPTPILATCFSSARVQLSHKYSRKPLTTAIVLSLV